jgi:Cu+-exporting ATPase
MARDPVCGMEVDSSTAEFTSEHDGQTYYFCSQECMEEFEQNPERYTHPSSVKGRDGGDRY